MLCQKNKLHRVQHPLTNLAMPVTGQLTKIIVGNGLVTHHVKWQNFKALWHACLQGYQEVQACSQCIVEEGHT